MKLFTVPKIPAYCEGIAHRLEKRKSGETKVVDLTLKIDPFDAQLASALEQDEYGFLKRTLFTSDGHPLPDLRGVELRAPHGLQRLLLASTPDTDPSFALDGVRVTKLRARCAKDSTAWVLYVYVSFGPVSKEELEYVNAYYCSQRWITWEESEQSFDFDAEEAPAVAARPDPVWDDGEEAPQEAESDAAREVGSRPTAKRGTRKKTAKHDPEAEREAQANAVAH